METRSELNLLARVVFGSKLYGTSIPTSDDDFRGVYLPSRRDCFLGVVQDVITLKGEEDTQLFSLQKFLRLAAEGQSVSLEMLFAGPRNIVSTSPIFEMIRQKRSLFITKKMTSFIGYARTMAGKYSSRVDRLLDVEKVREIVMTPSIWSPHAKLAEIYHLLPILPNTAKLESQFSKAEDKRVYHLCGREYSVHVTLEHFQKACDGIIKEYGSRVQAAKNNDVDYKALMHAFRVAYQCKALIEDGDLHFPLKESKYLRDMRLGRINFVAHKLDETLSTLIEGINTALTKSSLPDSVDWSKCEDIILEAYA